MFNLFKPLSNFLKIKDVEIYNTIFKLHSKLTVLILFAFAIIVTSKQFFGEHIDCMCDADSNVKHTMDTYCWILGSYISNRLDDVLLKKQLYGGIVAEHVPEAERNYQKYYQFVPFIFTFQVILFYLPALIWKCLEGGRLKKLCSKIASPVIPADWGFENKTIIVVNFYKFSQTSKRFYATCFFICEILNFLVVIINILFINWIFTDFFIAYTPAIKTLLFDYNYEKWNEHSSKVFPKLAKCTMTSYGPSGSQQLRDCLCILPLNIINEKLFVIIYLWLIILAVISGLNIINQFFIIICPYYRLRLLTFQFTEKYSRRFKFIRNIGDWFLLYKISKNVNPSIVEEIIQELIKSDEGKIFA